MAHPGRHRLLLLVVLVNPSAALALGPGEAAGRPGRAQTTADFKVIVWYNKVDALKTFQYQIYDVRKGEFTSKVDDWIKDVQVRYPAYVVIVREVDLGREKGATEMLNVGAVVRRAERCREPQRNRDRVGARALHEIGHWNRPGGGECRCKRRSAAQPRSRCFRQQSRLLEAKPDAVSRSRAISPVASVIETAGNAPTRDSTLIETCAVLFANS